MCIFWLRKVNYSSCKLWAYLWYVSCLLRWWPHLIPQCSHKSCFIAWVTHRLLDDMPPKKNSYLQTKIVTSYKINKSFWFKVGIQYSNYSIWSIYCMLLLLQFILLVKGLNGINTEYEGGLKWHPTPRFPVHCRESVRVQYG